MIFKKYFLHLPQWTCITYLKTEGKHLHMGQQIHSTLQNRLTRRQCSLRSLFIKKQFVFLLILKTLDCFLTFDTTFLYPQLYFSLPLSHTYYVSGTVWGALPCCFIYGHWEPMRLLLPFWHCNKGSWGWKTCPGQMTNYGSCKLKFKSNLVWLQNPELQNIWQLINCLF